MGRTAWAEIDLDSIRDNIRLVRRRLAPGTRLCGVFKGDAYGHGADRLQKCLFRDGLLDMAAVGKIREMKRLFAGDTAGKLEILLLGSLETEEVEEAIRSGTIPADRADFSVYNLRQLSAFEEAAERLGTKIRVHIRTDIWGSGMGLELPEFLAHEEEIFSAPNLTVCGVYGHLYSSYSDDHELTQRELESFETFVNSIRPEHRSGIIVHIMNSALIFGFPAYSFDMARMGAAMYGLNCGDEGALKPAMRICATVFDVRSVAGDAPLAYHPPVSEGVEYTGKRRIARIMVGYCDCPFLLTQQDVRVRIRGRLFPLADEVCMDNLCIDITGAEDIEVGDVAVLLGEDGVSVDEILERNHMAVIHSDWMSMTTERLEKIYIGEEE